MLHTELDFFNSHFSEWLKIHSGKFVLIKGQELVGVYNSQQDALAEGYKKFTLEPFFVKQINILQEPLNFSVNYNLV